MQFVSYLPFNTSHSHGNTGMITKDKNLLIKDLLR